MRDPGNKAGTGVGVLLDLYKAQGSGKVSANFKAFKTVQTCR